MNYRKKSNIIMFALPLFIFAMFFAFGSTATNADVPPTVVITASPGSVTSGSASTLTWVSTDATTCTASGDWTGAKIPSGSESTGNLTSGKIYNIACTGPGGIATAFTFVTITVAPPTPPTIVITASPGSIPSGSSSTLTWMSTDATSCVATGDWTGTKTTSGSESTGNLTSGKTYTIACTGPGGTAIAFTFVTVTIAPPTPPTVVITASPGSVTSGSASTLTWVSTDATTCAASGDWTGTKVTSGSESTGNLTSGKTYTIACTGPGGTATAFTFVTVTPVLQCLLPQITSSPSVSAPGGVNLGTVSNFAILSKSGISNTGSTLITGDIGVSPIAATAITGFALNLPSGSPFSTSPIVTGRVYAADYASPTPGNLTTAVLDMQNAYTDAAGRAPSVTELGAGNIGGMTLTPGVYKWSTGVTIPANVTLSGSANDVWIFQIAQNLSISSAKQVILSGGAQAGNIFWVVAGQTTIGTTAVFNGNILDQTAIVLNTGAALHGRALAQTAVTLDSNIVTIPAFATSTLVNQFFTYTITASSTTAVTFSVSTSTLPAGLSFSSVTNTISGIPTVAGTYNILITATNSCGVTTRTLVLTVNSPAVNTPPVLTLVGANPATVIVGNSYTDAGATALDLEDGNITANIVRTGTVNTGVVGTYTLTYNVSDSGGLPATPVTRTVNVVPVIPLPGKVTFCVILADASNVIATTSGGLPGGVFSMDLATSSSFGTSTIQSKTWITTSFSPNKRIILPTGFDADCITYQNLNLGTYFYSQLSVTGALWMTPQYNDQNTQPVNNIFDFFPYNANTNSDGQITLTSGNPDQTLVILEKDSSGLFCPAPQITSTLSRTATVGVPFSYTLTASSTTATTFSIGSLLPPGLSFSTTTNTISGIPLTSGTFNISLNAVNTCIGGIDAKILVLNILPVGTPSSDIAVSKTSDKTAGNVGDTITYTINVSNNGPNNATGVTATDILSDKLNFVSATTTQGSYSSVTGIWNIGNLSNGSSTVLTIVATIKSGNEGQTIVNTVTVSATQIDSVSGNNTASVSTIVNNPTPPGCTANCGGGGGGGGGSSPIANLIVLKTSNKTNVNVGDEIIYTINLLNAGPSDATGVVGSDPLPIGFNFLSATTTSGTYNPATGVWTIGNLNNASTASLTVHGIVKDGFQGQTISNSISVNSPNQTDSVPSNNTARVDVFVNGTGTGTATITTNTASSCYYLYDYLRRDFNNNPIEVRKLQVFLRDLEGFTNVQITGVYDDQTIVALDAFQARYASDILTPWGETSPTGYTYILTKKKVNEIYCRSAFPVTPQQQIEIDTYRNFLIGLQNAGIILPTNQFISTTTTPVLYNNQVGLSSTSDNSTLAGNSTTTRGIISRFTANVLFAGDSVFKWFGSLDWCGWLNIILLIIIAAILSLWYSERERNRKIEEINKEIDLS